MHIKILIEKWITNGRTNEEENKMRERDGN